MIDTLAKYSLLVYDALFFRSFLALPSIEMEIFLIYLLNTKRNS